MHAWAQTGPCYHYSNLQNTNNQNLLTVKLKLKLNLNCSDFKFDYHAEFIAQPISYTDMVISSLAESPGSDTLSSMTSCDSLQSSNILQCAGTTCVSSVAALDNLPSFTGFSDSDYTQSIMTTIEPRVFGSEAEYINRLKNRRDSCQDLQRHSVIVSPSQIQDPPPSPPSPSLGLLPASFQSYLSDNTHSDDKILLKEEPQVTTKVDDIFLSTDFGGLRGGPAISSPSASQTAAIPNFLHFTPDESVTQSVLSQCNKHEPTLSPSIPELDQPIT